ncbi:MAG: Gfo/Idh/MocA family oxidoreductase [Planctomycetota bacterium]
MSHRVNIGLVGLSGYANEIRKLLLSEGNHAEGRTRLAAVFAPDPELHAETIDDLRAQGVSLASSFDELLDADVEALWLPVPIDLHRPMTKQALAAGKAVMLEKPVAGCIDDHDAIARAAAAAGLPVAVGFQDIYRPSTLALKRRLLAGDFGTPESAVVWGLWPRDDAYYARSTWAGRLRRDDTWVLDSPIANAMAHYVNLALFLLGPSDCDAAPIASLTGETLRGRPTIENADTFSVRVHTRGQGSSDLVVLLTHATAGFQHPSVSIRTDRGVIDVAFDGVTTFTPTGGAAERLFDEQPHRPHMARRFARLVRGEDDRDIALATLASSRPHSVLISAVAESLPITPVDAHQSEPGGAFVIPGLDAAIERAAREHKTLGELGDTGLAVQSASSKDLAGYAHFASPNA